MTDNCKVWTTDSATKLIYARHVHAIASRSWLVGQLKFDISCGTF